MIYPNNIITSAIREKRCLSFIYDGYSRIVEPHCYGLTKKDNEVLRAYQIRGSGVHNNYDSWHLFSVSKMSFLQVTDETFQRPRPEYVKGDSSIYTIFCEL
jgi:hypothetical protein